MKKYSKLFLPLIYSLIFITAIWSYQNIETVNSNTNIFIHEVQIHTQNIINQVTGKKKQKPKLTKDNSQRTEKKATYSKPVGKWPTNSATIFINIKDPVLRSAAKSAIKAWNDTGSFTFHVVKKQKDANILFTTIDDDKDGAAGLTEANINSSCFLSVIGGVLIPTSIPVSKQLCTKGSFRTSSIPSILIISPSGI